MLGGGANNFTGGAPNGYLNPNTAENKRHHRPVGGATPTTGQAMSASASLILGTTVIQVGAFGFVKGAEDGATSNNFGGGGAAAHSRPT